MAKEPQGAKEYDERMSGVPTRISSKEVMPKKVKEENQQSRFAALVKASKERRARRDAEILLRQEKYRATRSGRVGVAIKKSFGFLKSPTGYFNSKNQISPAGMAQLRSASGYTKSRGGKRGRPYGSYKPLYAAYGGVYGYRKVLNAQLRAQRLQQMRDNTLTPQQQQLLGQLRMQQMPKTEWQKDAEETGGYMGANTAAMIDKEVSNYTKNPQNLPPANPYYPQGPKKFNWIDYGQEIDSYVGEVD